MFLFPQAGLVPLPAPSTSAAGVSRFSLPAESRCFEGHFDGAPILPGVAHLAMALVARAEQAPRDGVLTGVRDLRFSRPLRPGDEVEVVLTANQEPSLVRFEIRCRGELASAGILVFDSDRDVSGS